MTALGGDAVTQLRCDVPHPRLAPTVAADIACAPWSKARSGGISALAAEPTMSGTLRLHCLGSHLTTFSIRLSTAKCRCVGCNVVGMGTTRGERLRIARAEHLKSARLAGKAMGIPVSTYGAHERAESPGGRDYGPDEAKKYWP